MMAAAMSVFGGRIDPRLIKALATVPADRDTPRVSEDDATESETRPTLFTILRPLLVTVLLAGGVLLLAASVNLIPQGLFRIIVDDFKAGHHASADRTAFFIAGLALTYGALSYAFRVRVARVNESVMYMLRRRVFQRLSRLGVDYYDRELPGQVAARVVYDLDRISTFLDNGLYFMTVNTTLLLLAMGVILVWSPPVAAVVLPFVPVLLFFSGVQVPIADRAYDRQRARLGAVVERFHEDTAGRYVIDAFDAREQARASFQDRAWRLRQARRWSAGVSNGYIEHMNCAGNLAGAALISRAGSLSIAGKLSIGSMVALELYLLSALGPIAFLSEAMGRLMAARASFRTLRRPFATPILPVEREDAVPCPRLAGDIVLDHVTFHYPGTERVVLDDVLLEIPPGTSIALVGPTGAGKSSIAKLVARIYDADGGRVLIDGHDVRDLELSSYRRRLGVVPQDAFCFRGTVRENIAYGRPDATDEELAAAVEAVGAAHVLRALPSGLASTVEEEGRNLTAAQRQVIALARALLTDPDVLILDEATSSLDGTTEEGVLEAVRRIGRTTIFITHRLPVARRADLVAVVDGGQIVERGPHDQLIEQGGAYARLWAIGPEVTPDAVQEAAPGTTP
jgi:ATP-binding cassette subfamily B protein